MNNSNKSQKKEKKTEGAAGSDQKTGKEIENLEKAPKGIMPDVVDIITAEVAEKHKMAAFAKEGDVIKVAMVDPQNIDALNVLRFVGEKEKAEIKIYAVTNEVFSEILDLYSSTGEAVERAVKSFREDAALGNEGREGEDDKKQAETLKDAPVSKLVQVIISHAIEGHASDIHIESMDSDYRVRYRIDGVLHVSLMLPKKIGPVVISRIKILANLKIDEKRKPQDGRFRLTVGGKQIDFRVSTLPVIDGEKIVLRILDKEEGVSNVESLGLTGSAYDHMTLAIRETYGMILLTGPTGSGKSTTLYALLKILNNEERNIITLEDPIEYELDGLNQSQIKPEIGYTFASGLRTILRQDPNIIMVGEIRDGETAELAVHAALTGHLMFSTLHTNTAIGSIPRLIDMGIEPFLLSSALRLVAAQRLVRKICEDCREEEKVSESVKTRLVDELKDVSGEELKKYGVDLKAEVKLYHGKGCDNCNGTGLKGRLAIFEVVPVNEAIKTIIIEKAGSENLINEERDKMGVLTIKQDGILKVLKGMTTLEEVERLTEGKIGLAEEDV